MEPFWPTPAPAAIILTGGRSSRFGQHKPTVEVGETTMLDVVLAATGGLRRIVVGKPAGVPAGVRTVPDSQPDGGPVVGIATGLAELLTDDAAHPADNTNDSTLFVVAADLPFLTPRALASLERHRLETGADVALFVDGRRRRQHLCAAWSMRSLSEAIDRIDVVGAPVRALYQELRVTEVPDSAGVSLDVDTRADLEEARHRLT